MYLPQGEVNWTTKYYENIRKQNTTGNGLPKLTVAVTHVLTQSNPYNQVAMHINQRTRRGVPSKNSKAECVGFGTGSLIHAGT